MKQEDLSLFKLECLFMNSMGIKGAAIKIHN